jgi:hypothetical protein
MTLICIGYAPCPLHAVQLLPLPTRDGERHLCPDCAQERRRAHYAASLAAWRLSIGWTPPDTDPDTTGLLPAVPGPCGSGGNCEGGNGCKPAPSRFAETTEPT